MSNMRKKTTKNEVNQSHFSFPDFTESFSCSTLNSALKELNLACSPGVSSAVGICSGFSPSKMAWVSSISTVTTNMSSLSRFFKASASVICFGAALKLSWAVIGVKRDVPFLCRMS